MLDVHLGGYMTNNLTWGIETRHKTELLHNTGIRANFETLATWSIVLGTRILLDYELTNIVL